MIGAATTALLTWGATTIAGYAATKTLEYVGAPIANWGGRKVADYFSPKKTTLQKIGGFLKRENAGGMGYRIVQDNAEGIVNLAAQGAKAFYGAYKKDNTPKVAPKKSGFDTKGYKLGSKPKGIFSGFNIFSAKKEANQKAQYNKAKNHWANKYK